MKLKKIKIIHFITTLGLGGAESLFNILKNSNNKQFEHQVVCLNCDT